MCAQSPSHVGLPVTPWTVACPAPLSMGVSTQGHWSGLPGPPSGDRPNPGMEPRSPTLQADSLLSEPPGKLKNMEVGSLSLLQGIFSTQGSNPGLLHCRRVLYQLSHQGSPSYITGLHFAILMLFWKIVSFSYVPVIEPTWLFSRVFYLQTSFPSDYASECFIYDLYYNRQLNVSWT